MIVMDANAALAVAMGFDVGDALTLLRDEDEEIIAPTLLTAEVCHALSKYVRGGYMEVRDAVDCGRDALSLVDRFVDDSALWVESLSEAVRLDHSSYDMSICFSRAASVQRCSPLTASSRISAADAASIAYAR